ncbi:MAG: bifunctional indole-3-glycerol-phosphate synthase TrpC/phosphoribosylanthranilate isomerase TrpF [Pirellulaceae bacterium]
METILEEIVESRRKQLESQKQSLSLSSIQDSLQPSDRDLAGALKSPRPAFILECKKASPSQGLIRDNFDLADIADVYGRHASAISVLTESEYFQGSLKNLDIVRQRVSQPLLCKDFFVDPYQVYQARHFGADAILLILAILDDDTWRQLFELARSMEMDAITEVSNREEQQRAIKLGAPIVGINNRNLRDMSINLDTTRQLADALPEGTLVISESGYHTNQQIRSMNDVAHGFLVGSSLMKEPDLERAVKSLILGDHKVCGLTRNEDARAADQAGAVYGGVIFAEDSPRRVSIDDVDSIFEDCRLQRIGVFQNQSLEEVAKTVLAAHLDGVQLHGDESPQYVRDLRGRIGEGVAIWKALTVDQLTEHTDSFLDASADRLVVDNQEAGLSGGTGRPFDWSRLPAGHRQSIIVAGGIGPDNVIDALRLGCHGVDMNSGLEDAPGIKSAEKIKKAFRRIRNYQVQTGDVWQN